MPGINKPPAFRIAFGFVFLSGFVSIASRMGIAVLPGGRVYIRYAVEKSDVRLRRERKVVWGVKSVGM